MKTKPDHRIEKKSKNVLANYFEDVKAGWEKWYLLRSDAHHDSAGCRRDLEIKHLEQAKKIID